MKKINNKGFSIILGIGISFVFALLSLYIISLVVPYSRQVKGIENSTRAYYNAASGVEEAMLKANEANRNGLSHSMYNTPLSRSGPSTGNDTYDYKLDIQTKTIPQAGMGNSLFDNNWNILQYGDPIQLDIKNMTSNPSLKIFLRVPDLNDGERITLNELPKIKDHAGNPTIRRPLFSWQISSDNDSFYPLKTDDGPPNKNQTYDNFYFKNQVGGSDTSGEETKFFTSDRKKGQNITSDVGISDQYSEIFVKDKCSSPNEKCIFQFSLLENEMIGLASSGLDVTIPYLEYKIKTTNKIPDQYLKIDAFGKAYGFTRNIEVRYPQDRINQAYTFTVIN